jgi:hypothetical protein
VRRPALVILRGAALLTLGALAVHQLRYLIAFGPSSGEALHREGHGYLAAALPVLVALAVALLAATLVTGALARSAAGAGLGAGPGRALFYAAALLSVFVSQELVEGALAPGHPAGLAAVVEGGAWVAAPLALGFGVIAAVVERLLDRAEEIISAGLAPAERPAPAADPPPATPWEGRAPLAAAPLAFGLARRPPPAPARP